MIERVEIISGGASAVYGADAIGGVSNFIMRNDFEGLEVDAQYGIDRSRRRRGESAPRPVRHQVRRRPRQRRVRDRVLQPRRRVRQAIATSTRMRYTDPTVGGDFIGFGCNGYNRACAFNPPTSTRVNDCSRRARRDRPGAATGSRRASWRSAARSRFRGLRFNPNGIDLHPDAATTRPRASARSDRRLHRRQGQRLRQTRLRQHDRRLPTAEVDPAR